MHLFTHPDSEAGGAFVLPAIKIERYTTPAVHQTAAGLPEHHRLHRELLAVLVGDVAGYARLVERNDVDTVVRLRHLRRELVEPETAARGGHVVRFAGDSVLAAFADAPAAIDCALAIQRGAGVLNRGIASALHLRLRIGISFGAVLVDDDDDLHGQAVNIAARLERLAEPGSIYLTGAAFDRLIGRSGLRCEALGARRLRHITEPVRVYRVAPSELLARPARPRRPGRTSLPPIDRQLTPPPAAGWRGGSR